MPETTVPAALAAAVREHATVLPRIEEASDTDLDAVDAVVGNARVVAIGEATHFVAEFGDIRRRLVRHLAERHGFTVLAAEFGFAEAVPLDRWLHGDGAEDDLAGYRGTTNSGVDATMARWLREHNATSDQPLQFVGLDTPVAGGTLRPVLEPLATFLEVAYPDVVDLVRTAEAIASPRGRATGYQHGSGLHRRRARDGDVSGPARASPPGTPGKTDQHRSAERPGPHRRRRRVRSDRELTLGNHRNRSRPRRHRMTGRCRVGADTPSASCRPGQNSRHRHRSRARGST